MYSHLAENQKMAARVTLPHSDIFAGHGVAGISARPAMHYKRCDLVIQ